MNINQYVQGPVPGYDYVYDVVKNQWHQHVTNYNALKDAVMNVQENIDYQVVLFHCQALKTELELFCSFPHDTEYKSLMIKDLGNFISLISQRLEERGVSQNQEESKCKNWATDTKGIYAARKVAEETLNNEFYLLTSQTVKVLLENNPDIDLYQVLFRVEELKNKFEQYPYDFPNKFEMISHLNHFIIKINERLSEEEIPKVKVDYEIITKIVHDILSGDQIKVDPCTILYSCNELIKDLDVAPYDFTDKIFMRMRLDTCKTRIIIKLMEQQLSEFRSKYNRLLEMTTDTIMGNPHGYNLESVLTQCKDFIELLNNFPFSSDDKDTMRFLIDNHMKSIERLINRN